MKRFQFSLAAVLTLRQRSENAALKAYAEALLAREQAFARLDAIHRELGANWREIRQLCASPCPAAKIDQLRAYGNSLAEERVRREAALSRAERVVSMALQKMLAARQEREAIDTFRHNQTVQYERDLIGEERKFLDDLALRPVIPGTSWRPMQGD